MSDRAELAKALLASKQVKWQPGMYCLAPRPNGTFARGLIVSLAVIDDGETPFAWVVLDSEATSPSKKKSKKYGAHVSFDAVGIDLDALELELGDPTNIGSLVMQSKECEITLYNKCEDDGGDCRFSIRTPTGSPRGLLHPHVGEALALAMLNQVSEEPWRPTPKTIRGDK